MNITNLSCDICGYEEKYSINPVHEHPELELGGVPLNIWTPKYNLKKIKNILINNSQKGIMKFNNLIPINLNKNIVSNEGNTPLIKIDGAYLKDESNNPTGSFKDRGIASLVSEAIYYGIKTIAIPSTGNAAISLGYYGTRAGIETIVFIPSNTSFEKIEKIKNNSEIIMDSNIIESYEHFFRFCKKNKEIYNGFPANNIAYLQGLKTISYELFIQLNDNVPDSIIIPVGSGGNLVGIYYGFKDLVSIGLAKKMPRLISVQLNDADPITQGFIKNQTDKLLILNSIPQTKAEAIASDTCFNYFKILNIFLETGGEAISVSEKEIENSFEYNLEYSSRAIFPALKKLSKNNVDFGNVVLIGTASKKS